MKLSDFNSADATTGMKTIEFSVAVNLDLTLNHHFLLVPESSNLGVSVPNMGSEAIYASFNNPSTFNILLTIGSAGTYILEANKSIFGYWDCSEWMVSVNHPLNVTGETININFPEFTRVSKSVIKIGNTPLTSDYYVAHYDMMTDTKSFIVLKRHNLYEETIITHGIIDSTGDISLTIIHDYSNTVMCECNGSSYQLPIDTKYIQVLALNDEVAVGLHKGLGSPYSNIIENPNYYYLDFIKENSIQRVLLNESSNSLTSGTPHRSPHIKIFNKNAPVVDDIVILYSGESYKNGYSRIEITYNTYSNTMNNIIRKFDMTITTYYTTFSNGITYYTMQYNPIQTSWVKFSDNMILFDSPTNPKILATMGRAYVVFDMASGHAFEILNTNDENTISHTSINRQLLFDDKLISFKKYDSTSNSSKMVRYNCFPNHSGLVLTYNPSPDSQLLSQTIVDNSNYIRATDLPSVSQDTYEKINLLYMKDNLYGAVLNDIYNHGYLTFCMFYESNGEFVYSTKYVLETEAMDIDYARQGNTYNLRKISDSVYMLGIVKKQTTPLLDKYEFYILEI